jgi:hypothetical protein
MVEVTAAEASDVKVSGVEVKQFDGRMENAYGKELDTPIDFEGTYEHLKSYDAIPAKELPDKKEVLAYVNRKRLANERQKAMQAALDAAGIVKPTMETDEELQIRSIVRGLVASKKHDEASARAVARQILGLPEETE